MYSAFGVDHGQVVTKSARTGSGPSATGGSGNTMAALGGASAGIGVGTGGGGPGRAQGQGPDGLHHKEAPYEKPTRRRQGLGSSEINAKAHGLQTKVAGGLAVGGLGLAGAYKHAQRKEMRKPQTGVGKAWTPETKRKTRDAAMGAGTVGVGGTAIAAGGHSGRILGEHAYLHGAHAKEAHGYLEGAQDRQARAEAHPGARRSTTGTLARSPLEWWG